MLTVNPVPDTSNYPQIVIPLRREEATP